MPETHTPTRVNGTNSKTASLSLQRDWSFAKTKTSETLWGPHGYHRYPAKFIPQLVRRIIEQYSLPGDLVGDTFLGSGTTGVEALRCKRGFWGIDINPIAVFISRVKCTPLEPAALDRAWLKLSARLEHIPRLGRRFLLEDEKKLIASIDIARAAPDERFKYWFPQTHVATLEAILELVLEVRGETTRAFFLCAFSNILRSCSIWLSGSTKPQKDLSKRLSDPVERFCWQGRDMIRRNRNYWNDLSGSYDRPSDTRSRFTIRLGDARSLSLDACRLDLLVTSSPYATCYQYLELHQLSQLWFERWGLIGPIRLQQNCIGSYGPNPSGQKPPSTGSKAADKALLKLASVDEGAPAPAVAREVNALRKYFLDMGKVLEESARVVAPNKYLAMVIGDSCKRGITIPTSRAISELADLSGFNLERRFVRKVPGRVLVTARDRATGRFSSIEGSDTQAYPEEDVLIFKRRRTLDEN